MHVQLYDQQFDDVATLEGVRPSLFLPVYGTHCGSSQA